MASKEATAMQQRMMQFIHRGSNSHDTAAEPATDASAAKAEVAAAEDTQNSPQGKNIFALGNKAAISNKQKNMLP